MTVIMREYVLYIFYQLKFNEVNVMVVEKRFKRIRDEYDIC